MDLLEGSIAFALALAGFATICTVLVEILQRIVGLRSSGLKQMLEAYFEDTIKPKLAGQDAERLQQDLLNRLMENPLIKKFTTDTPLGLVRRRLLTSTAVSTEDFLRRLPETDLFQQLKQDSSEQAEALTRELADKYDQFGAAASDYFKRRAQVISILVGILLALFANIHAVRLFDTFVKNPELAQQMQAQAENIRKELEKPSAQPTLAAEQKPQAAPQAGAPGQGQGTPASADKTRDDDSIAAIKKDLQEAVGSLDSYEKMGLPIGWNYYPNCLVAETKDLQCKPITDKLAANDKADKKADLWHSIRKTLEQDTGAALTWLFGVLLTGLLIGLGGPFWFDVAVRLSQVRQALTGKAAIQPLTAAPVESDRDKAIAATTKRLVQPQNADARQDSPDDSANENQGAT